VYANEDFDNLLDYHKWDYTIQLVSRAESKISKIYILFSIEKLELDMFIVKNLYMEQIRPFKFSIVMPVFFIKKKNGFLRLMQDYKTFSIMIIKNKYLLSVISQLVTKLLQRICYLTELDICWRFNNICIKPRNK